MKLITKALEYKSTQFKITFVPKSVKAIAMLFFAISKFGDTAKHLNSRRKGKHFIR